MENTDSHVKGRKEKEILSNDIQRYKEEDKVSCSKLSESTGSSITYSFLYAF